MEFKRFAQFLKERLTEESHANKEAMEFDTCMRTIRNRFPNQSVEEIEKIIKTAGYNSIRDLAAALKKDQNVWQRIKMPRQGNYVGQEGRPF